MRPTSTRRRLALTTLLTALALGAATAPGVSVARPIDDLGGGPKDCNLLGTRIRNGERGRRGGVEYECKDGKACQVENGRTIDRCSHAARVRLDLGAVRGGPIVGARR